MNGYEGVFILSDSLQDEALQQAAGRVRAEIEKLGGEVQREQVVGRRSFARRMQKRDAGCYVLYEFKLAPDKVDALKSRYALSEEIFRFQINRLSEQDLRKAAAAAEAPTPTEGA